MSISFGSINTGLPKDIVKQIVASEQIPVRNMENQKGKIQDKKTLVDQLIKLAEDLRGSVLQNASARSLREFKHETNEEIVGINIDKNTAIPGNYQLEVLALAQKSSAMSVGFEDKDTSYVGVGFIQYTLPDGETKDIYIDSDNSSLSSIAKLINKETKLGVSANVINDGSGSDNPWRLILSLGKTGDEAAVTFPHFYFVDGEQDFQLEKTRDAHDAKIKLDGFEIEVPENKTSDLIPGITIDLKKAKPGDEFTLKISEDVQAVGTKVSGLVEKINNVLKFIKEQNTMDEKTDTSRTLGGDIMLQSLQGRLHSAIFKDIATETGYKRASEIGLVFNREGLLEFDNKKFESKLSENYNMVSQILNGYIGDKGKSDGLIDNLNSVVGSTLRTPDGLIQSRKKTLQSNIEQIDRKIHQKQKQIEEKEKNLKDKFARLEGTISRIRSQGAGMGGGEAQQL